MLSLNTSCCGCCGISTATRAFQFHFRTSPSPFFSSPTTNNYKFRYSITRATSTFSDKSNSNGEPKSNYSGVQLEETVDRGTKSGKLRLDSWISSRINGISRARVQSSIKAGLVHVNGRVVDKVINSNSLLFSCYIIYVDVSNFFAIRCNSNLLAPIFLIEVVSGV
jgi:tRNA pseudouridine synthase 2